MKKRLILLLGIACMGAAPAPMQPPYDEIPARLTEVKGHWRFERRIIDIPMRDGVTLHTVLLIPKGARNAPMLLTRTPYGAEAQTGVDNAEMGSSLDVDGAARDIIIDGGYIRVLQDIRGKNGSGGTFVVTRPLASSAHNPTEVDESTDAWDTIDWLSRNVPESSGKVGIMGISYDGFEVLMALVNPHPALKVAIPINPMVDGWTGDDWFHNGAFRQIHISGIYGGIATKDYSSPFVSDVSEQYEAYLRAGSAGDFTRKFGVEQIGFWQKLVAHPAFDDFWSSQAMDKVLADVPLKVPVMLVHSLWDQEDIYGASAVYRALEPKDANGRMVYLTVGPWAHGQTNSPGSHHGKIDLEQDTTRWWRKNILAPFLAHHLKGEPMDIAPVTAFRTGANEWQRHVRWPTGNAASRLYLQPAGRLGFDAVPGPTQSADYVSDPAHPVPFVPRPVVFEGDDETWKFWLTSDQRHAASRPDVLTFVSDVLPSAVTIAGRPKVGLTASTSGTDSDWVVKLIDVYPDIVPGEPKMGGYQLGIAMDIFRGRYRESLAVPKALVPGKPLHYSFTLPDANHVFRPGHRIMVQIQSSWFPLYDRNPQTYVPNIFNAKPGDYAKATQRVIVAGPEQSFIELPVQR